MLLAVWKSVLFVFIKVVLVLKPAMSASWLGSIVLMSARNCKNSMEPGCVAVSNGRTMRVQNVWLCACNLSLAVWYETRLHGADSYQQDS